MSNTSLTNLKQRSFDSNEGLSKKQISQVIDSFLDNIKTDMSEGKDVSIKNFARFSTSVEGDTVVPTVKWSKSLEFNNNNK